MPLEAREVAGAWDGFAGRLLVYSGGGVLPATLWQYDPGTGRWLDVTPGDSGEPMPAAALGALSCADRSRPVDGRLPGRGTPP